MSTTSEWTIDRLAIRSRPHGSPVMYQTWEKLLFLHWPLDPGLIRPLVPEALSLDLHDGMAWVGVTSFTMTGVRPMHLPAVPGLSSFHELNVRTYVHYQGVPGVWFFSLYASKAIPVLGARLFFSLPYKQAEMALRQTGNRIHYFLRSVRPAADFEAQWEIGGTLPPASVDSLEFFASERYCLYSSDGTKLYRCRVYHVPWQLRSAKLTFYRSTLLSAEGLPEGGTAPLVHYGGDQNVEVWPLEEI